jgi:hypothetical protein
VDAPAKTRPFRPGGPGALPPRLDPTLGPAARELGDPADGPEAGMPKKEKDEPEQGEEEEADPS